MMKGQIVRYGVDDRDHMVNFLNRFYAVRAVGSIRDDKMSPSTLSKNWSCFLYEREGKNFLIFFDGDDGSGGTAYDCKLVWPRFQNLVDHYRVDDYLVFKVQHARVSEQRQFYPFKRDVYPLALMTNDPERIFQLAASVMPRTQDIDVLFVGGRVHDHNKPYCWPKHRDVNQHWPTNRRIGYDKLLEIRDRRDDLQIVAVDGLLPPDQYYDLVDRSKICLDLPGIGLSSRKFYEFMVLGKCVVALEQNSCCWPLAENEHYVSLGQDYNYRTLESTIDRLLKSPETIEEVGKAAASLRPHMSHEAVAEYVEKIIDEYVEAWFNGTIESKRVWYR